MGRASRRKRTCREDRLHPKPDINEAFRDFIVAEGDLQVTYPSGASFVRSGKLALMPPLVNEPIEPGLPVLPEPVVLELDGTVAILDPRATIELDGKVIWDLEQAKLSAGIGDRPVILLCRPRDLDLSDPIDQKIATDTGVYTGSVEGTCEICGCGVWIGPRVARAQQEHPDTTVACFRCAPALPEPGAVFNLGNHEHDYLL